MRRKGNRPDQVAAANEALELVRLSGMGNRLPRELSGGQQQRVAFARAVIAGPRVLLLDEPLSNLDARLREEMQVELIELHSKLRLTTLFVTHDQAEALSMASLVVLMRDGRIEQIDAPAAIYHRPRTRFAADFIGGANLLRAEIEADPAGGWRARLASGVVFPVPEVSGGRGGEHVVAIRQEDLVLSRDPTGFDGALPTRILTEVYRGSNVRYVATLGDERVSVLTTRRLERNGQEPLYLCWRKDRVNRPRSLNARPVFPAELWPPDKATARSQQGLTDRNRISVGRTMARRGCRAAFRRWKTCPEGEFSSHEPRERKIDPDERAEPLKAEPRDGDEGGVDGNRVVARPGEDLDGVHDGKAKAFGEARVDAVVLRPGVDEGARGPGLERGLGIPRERGDVDVEARTVRGRLSRSRASSVSARFGKSCPVSGSWNRSPRSVSRSSSPSTALASASVPSASSLPGSRRYSPALSSSPCSGGSR